MKKTNEQIEKEQRELKIIKVIFDEDEDGHLRDVNFEEYLLKIGKQDLGKQIKSQEEKNVAVKKLTKEQIEFEEYTSSGGTKTFKEFKEMKK